MSPLPIQTVLFVLTVVLSNVTICNGHFGQYLVNQVMSPSPPR